MGEVPRALYDAIALKELDSSRRAGTLRMLREAQVCVLAGMSFASRLDGQTGVIA
jgi:hypothetical protein